MTIIPVNRNVSEFFQFTQSHRIAFGASKRNSTEAPGEGPIVRQ